MKKVFLTIAMTMFMSMGFAQSNFNFDVRRLADKLQLNEAQIESVEVINDNLVREIDAVMDLNGFDKMSGFRVAINNDIKSMRSVLNEEQFREYVVLLLTTVRNNIYNNFNK